MHPQDHDRSIIRLTSSRKFVHRCEDRVDHVVSALFIAFGRCPSEALYAPLLVGRIYCFNDPVSVSEDQVARIKLNRAFFIGPIRKTFRRVQPPVCTKPVGGGGGGGGGGGK